MNLYHLFYILLASFYILKKVIVSVPSRFLESVCHFKLVFVNLIMYRIILWSVGIWESFQLWIYFRFIVSKLIVYFLSLKGTPLFDGSCRFIDPQTIQSIQQCHLLLSNLNTVLSCFATEAQEITERGVLFILPYINEHFVKFYLTS